MTWRAEVFRSAKTGWALSMAAVLGALASVVLLGPDFITGVSSYWSTVVGDQGQALTGWIAYKNEPWGLPLFHVRTLGFPVGTNVVFTDSVPVVALLFKPLAGFLSPEFHYFGYWLAACYSLQAVASVALVRAMGERSYLGAVAAASLGVATPVFLRRFTHLALSGHFLVLFALTAYFVSRREGGVCKGVAGASALLPVAFLVHPYLGVMVAAIAAATVLSAASRSGWVRPFAVLAAGVAATVGLMFLGVGSDAAATSVSPGAPGYGLFSLNLLGPFVPQASGLIPGHQGVLDATGYQWFEGYSYLGAGVLLLLVVWVAFGHQSILRAVRRHLSLCLVLAGLLAFAVTNRVTIGDQVVATTPLSGWSLGLAEAFRSSGRFVWPILYVVMASALVGVLRLPDRRLSVAVVIVAVLLQAADVSGIAAEVHRDADTVRPTVLDAEIWKGRFDAAEIAYVEPPHACTYRLGATYAEASYELQRIAAETATPISSVAAARRTADCQQRSAPSPEAGSLYVRLGPDVEAPAGLDCRQFPLGLWCHAP